MNSRAAREPGRARAACASAATLAQLASLTIVAGCDAPRQISDSGFGAYEVSLATRGDDGFVVAWYDTRDGNAEIYVRYLDAAGAPVGADRRLTSTSDQSYEADVATLADGIAVAWYEKTAARALRARVGTWTRELEPRWSIELGDAGHTTRNPVVRATADGLFAAWIEREPSGRESVRGAWLDANGAPLGSPVVLGLAGATTWNLNAAIGPGGAAFVVYDAVADTRAPEVFVAELDGAAAKLTRLTADDGIDSKYPDIAIAGARFALTWFDERDGNQEVYLTQGLLDADLREDALEHARRVTDTPGHSIGAYLAWNDATIGLAWCDDTSGAHEVYFQAFTDAGEPSGAARRLTSNATSSLIPAIKPWRGGFALAWNEMAPGREGVHDEGSRSEVMFELVAR